MIDINASAQKVVNRQIERGASEYVRERDIPKLLGTPALWLSDQELIKRLKIGITVEQNRLHKSRWTASIDRLVALKQALAAERSR